MIPVLTVAEMRAADAAAQAGTPLDALVERAGSAVARAGLAMLGGSYGRRAVVVAGRGNNGADGRVAAARLAARGVRVSVVEPQSVEGTRLPPCDLYVDAAYGTGFRGAYRAPVPPPGTRVLAVDIPSGIRGDTGEASGDAVRAQRTVTFAALKPGLLLGTGAEHAGALEVADIGLATGDARAHLVEDGDVAAAMPSRPREAHKWMSALLVIAGSPGMLGSAAMCAAAAARAGAGMVRLAVPGVAREDLPATEAVASALGGEDWAGEVMAELSRCHALVVGPGLGRSAATAAAVRTLVAEAPVPVLADADGLNVLGSAEALAELMHRRATAGIGHPVVLTPHSGEAARLAGAPPGADRLAAARSLAVRSGAVVLLKGSTSVVAAPDGDVLLAAAGSARLATAGTGDVLSGVIGAFMAQGMCPFLAAGLGAHVHGRAAGEGLSRGLVAGDLPLLVAGWLSGVGGGAPPKGPGAGP